MTDRLELRDLGCVRGERIVFKRLSAAVEAGETLRLVGANGSGKSSLLRLVAGLGVPAAGAIAWNAEDVTRDPEAHRRRTLFLGHQDAVKPWLSVAENLRFWMALHGAEGGRAEPALDALALAHLAAVPARLLSQGQRRRLALAKFAAIPARLWLLDEPTTSLDDKSVAAVEGLIARHCAGGGVAVISTHLALALPGEKTLRLDAAGGAA